MPTVDVFYFLDTQYAKSMDKLQAQSLTLSC